jgi:hypothetical protein
VKNNLIICCLANLVFASCSNSQKPIHRKTVSTEGVDASASASAPAPASVDQTIKPAVTPLDPADCPSLWTLAVSQQVLGAKFVYDTIIALPSSSLPVVRDVLVTASSSTGITSKISVDDPMLKLLVPGALNQDVTVNQENFLSTCAKFGGLPIQISGVTGDIVIKEQVDDSISINGQQLAVKRVSIQATDVKYGSYTVSADIIAYVSTKYPLLPLKQKITITKSPNISMLLGAVISDVLKVGLPATQ